MKQDEHNLPNTHLHKHTQQRKEREMTMYNCIAGMVHDYQNWGVDEYNQIKKGPGGANKENTGVALELSDCHSVVQPKIRLQFPRTSVENGINFQIQVCKGGRELPKKMIIAANGAFTKYWIKGSK